MTDETTTTETTTTATGTEQTAAAAATSNADQATDENYNRYKEASRKAKESAERAKGLERQIADLQAQIEERESAGLPEVEQMKKRLEAAEKRAEDNERKATDAEAKVARGAKERWVIAAAQAQNFADPSDAAAFLSLDEIEDEKDAERAVKRLAASKKHLLKSEDPKLPGRVLENGQPVKQSTTGGIDLDAEAQMVSNELKKFLASRNG